MRMDHPFILGVCQNVTFDIVCTMQFHVFPGGREHFLKLVSYLNSFMYLRFKYGRPQIIIIIIIIIQNKIHISE